MIIKQSHGEVTPNEAKQKQFVELLNPVWNPLARYCNSMASDKETARDLMSETLLRGFQHFEKLREPSAFRAYLFRIAVRVHLEWRKRNQRMTPLTEELTRHLEQTTLAEDGRDAERSLDVGDLYAALDTLPEKQREALVLFEISGLSLNEIKNIQGGSLSGVKSRIVRGREALAGKMGVHNPKRDFKLDSDDAKESGSSLTSPNMTRNYAFSGKGTL